MNTLVHRSACLLCLGLMSVIALGAEVVVNDQPRPRLDVPQALRAPAITAQTDDPAWATAAVIPALTMSLGPQSEGLTALPTEVRLLWDPQYLYIRVRCEDASIYTPVTGRDAPLYSGDTIEIFLDPTGDGKQYVELQVNPNNDVLDILHLHTGEPTTGPTLLLDSPENIREQWHLREWTYPGWRTAAAKTPTGWLIDAALPAAPLLKRLGLPRYQPMTLRANILRYDYLVRSEKPDDKALIDMNWAPTIFGRPHISPASMGYLRLVAPPQPQR